MNPRASRVCLIHPPTLTSVGAYGLDVVAPLGLAYIAAALKNAGRHVSVVDGIGEALQQYGSVPEFEGLLVHGMSLDEVVSRIDPDAGVIGISNMFSNQWLFVRDLARRVRRAFPDRVIVLGGEHVTACAEHIIENCPEVDVCVLGEGEETMVGLVSARAEGRDLREVGGLVLRSEGRAHRTANRPRIRAVDEIPEPDWSLVPIEKYIDNACTYGFNIGRSIPMLASRGCPFECTFCSSPEMWTTRWSVRDPRRVIAEMKKYMRLYGVTNFDFYDLTAIVKKDWIADFCRLLIKEDLKITWQLPSGTRSEALDAEITALLHESGCRFLIYAPESGSVPELRRIKKKVNLDKMLDSMRAARKAGIETKANLIFGMLGATWRDVFNTFGFIFRLAVAGVDNVTGYPFSPYPGSEDFRTLEREGRLGLSDDYFRSLLMLCRNLHTKNTVSYNDAFSSTMLGLICSCAFIFFYSVSYLLRPWRLAQLIHTYFIKNEASSILTLAFANVRRKKAVAKLMTESRAPTALVPQEFQIRNKAG
ncbi:MAG: B12-binding domain-containing radical SAM protein [Elusimicrobia bacterium]|nr:B12-binding domain-containing radical SAM protein [Elusimicrobiota bacterium]